MQVTGEEDDVTTYLDPDHVGGVDVDVPATFPPGLHVANTVVTYQWLVNGENKLRDQDQHQLWIAALSNNSAALCYVREPYDYPDGQDTTTVRVRQGPAVKIGGVSPNTLVETITKSKLQHRYLRGFSGRRPMGGCAPVVIQLPANCLAAKNASNTTLVGSSNHHFIGEAA